MNDPYYVAIAMHGRFCVAHRLPGIARTYGIDADCPSLADAQGVAEKMNERREATLKREADERALLTRG